MAATPIKLGVVGLSATGSWAVRSHLPYLSRTSNYEIVALQNSSKASAEKAAQKHNLSHDVTCYGDIDSLVSDPNVKMVMVSVKVPSHAALIEPALKAKKDIFVEWPLAANLSEAEHLTSLAASNKVKTLVGLQARHNPSIRKAKAMVDGGELGDILGSTMNATGMILGATCTEDFMYGLPVENGANLVTIPAGHAMDAMCYVLGELKDLQATLANNRPKVAVVDGQGEVIKTVEKSAHDYMAVTGTFQRGGVASVVYQGGMSSTGKNFYWEINGTKGSLVLEGGMGHVQMFQPTVKFVKAEQGAKLENVEVEQAKDYSYNVGSAWDSFVGKGDGHVTTFEDALLRHKMIDAIYKSDKNGTRESYI